MANYCCTTRTNYFRVKDPEAFREFMGRVHGCEDSVELFTREDDVGNTRFGFGLYSGIYGLENAEADETTYDAYDSFIEGLKQHVAEDDAIIILEAGNEKLRYVTGMATIVTAKEYQHLDITMRAQAEAAKMLGNKNWITSCEY